MRSELAGAVASTALLTAFLLFPCRGTAQVPNSGFESWDGGEPQGWSTTNMYTSTKSVFVSYDSHSGSFAARGEAPYIRGSYRYAWLIAEFPCSEIPERMKLHYKFMPKGEDGLYVGVSFQDRPGYLDLVVFAGGGAEVLVPAPEYTALDIPVERTEPGMPTYCRITIGIEAAWAQGMGAEPTAASAFIVDDISFEGVMTSASNDAEVPMVPTLEQNYPNPFNPSTTIRYGLPDRSPVTLTVFNSVGQQVARVVDGEQEAGFHEVQFDASGLASGVYLYRLQAGSVVQTRRFVLLR